MISLVGIVIVIAAVFGGYLLEHGELALLIQPAEYVIIWGAALGSLVIATPLPVIKRLLLGFKKILSGGRYTKAFYMETLKLFFSLFQTARRQGVIGLERDVDEPQKSAIFIKHKAILQDHHALHFICDTLRMAITGGVSPFDVDQMIEADLEVHHEHNRAPVQSLAAVADALPGLGIVAAVLGIVITMSSLGGPPEELGHKVAAALVGTFLGVLTCYGFVGPLAAAVAAADESEAAYYRVLKAGLVAFIKGHPPIMAMEFARRAIPHDVRPSFAEMEKQCKTTKTQE